MASCSLSLLPSFVAATFPSLRLFGAGSEIEGILTDGARTGYNRGVEISDVRVYPFESREGASQVRAYADVTFDGQLLVKGFKVVMKPSGALFVSYPSARQQGGEFVQTVAALSPDLRSKIREAVVAKYREYFPKE